MSKDNSNKTNENVSSGLGDMSIFLKDNSLIKVTSMINSHYAMGLPQKLGQNGLVDADSDGIRGAEMSTSQPGVLAVEWIPCVGTALTATDPINRAGTNNYRRFRNGNWTQNYFDIADVSYYFLSCTNTYILYNWLGMIYKHIQNVERENLYAPQSVIESLGCDWNDMRENQAQLLFLIKQVERKISIMAIPKSFLVVRRWLSMTSHIYKDRDISKAQYLAFAPKYLLYYDINTMKLKYLDFKPSTLMKIADIEYRVNTMLNALYPDEEMMRFNADVTNYITKDVYTVNDIDWADMTTPVYDADILEQFHNADFLSYSAVTDLDIVQVISDNADSIIKWDPTFTSNEVGMLAKKVVDFDHEDPTSEDVVRNTRWKFTIKLTGSIPASRGANFTFKIKSCGTELLMNPNLYIYDSKDMRVIKIPMSTNINTIGGSSTAVPSGYFVGFAQYPIEGTNPYPHNSFGTDFNSLIYLTKFNRAPLRYFTMQDTFPSGFKNVLLNTIGEIGNCVLMEDDQLDVINRACLQSVFGLDSGNESR